MKRRRGMKTGRGNNREREGQQQGDNREREGGKEREREQGE